MLQVKPDLVTLCAGGNDLIVPGSDVDAIAEEFEQAVVDLRAAGCEVVVFTGPDPRKQPVVRRVRGKVAIYNAHLRAIADRHGAQLVDLWAMARAASTRASWSDDRLHFSPEGHQRIALRTAEVLDCRSPRTGASRGRRRRRRRGCGPGRPTSRGPARTCCRGCAGSCAASRRATASRRSGRSCSRCRAAPTRDNGRPRGARLRD